MVMVSVCGVGGVKAATSDEYKELVVKAYDQMSKMQSYRMTMDITGSMTLLGKTTDIVMHGDCDTQVKPMLAKNVMKVTVGDGTAKKDQMITQYIEESKGQINVYTNNNGKWEKMSMAHYDPIADYADFAKGISNVALVEENDETFVFAVTIDGSYLKENIDRVMNSASMKKANLPEDIFKNIGDITYKVTIDKKTSVISKTDMELSDLFAAIGKSFIDRENKLSDTEKAMVREIFNNMKFNVTMVISKINSVDKITIPNEVKMNSLLAKPK
jgi:hypothetical protein